MKMHYSGNIEMNIDIFHNGSNHDYYFIHKIASRGI